VRRRLVVALAFVALWAGAIAWRLYGLQVVRHEEFVRRAERQQQRVIELDPPLAYALHQRQLPGLYFLEESKRYYPMREVAGALLGYVGTDNRGLAGLEAEFEKVVAACERLAPVLVRWTLDKTTPGTLPCLFGPLHKGDDAHMSMEQFDTFYWPSR